MAPTKSVRPLTTLNTKSTISTRSRASHTTNILIKEVRNKRKADGSPTKEMTVKRSALGELTNNTVAKVVADKAKAAMVKATNNAAKKVMIRTKILPSVKTVAKVKQNENLGPPLAPGKVQTRSSLRKDIVVPNQTAQKPKVPLKENTTANAIRTKRLSNEFEKNETLYCTALEDSNASTRSSVSRRSKSSSLEPDTFISAGNVTLVAQQLEKQLNLGNHEVPDGVVDFDKENWEDVFQVSHYAMDIFNYLKSREEHFKIGDYMVHQVCLTKWMRSLLVDWMVEIQESFELNHETLYLGVKLVDLYLCKVTVGKETLQLVGAASMFIASKFDERIPPLVDDFLYICDGAYTRKELLRMEINILKVINFDLGIPLSYRFLRRYARTAKVTMPILTLARYILEYSLMDYSTVTLPDSKLAAASLFLALQMKKVSGWTSTLEFYTGYKYQEIEEVVHLLNEILHKKIRDQLSTVRNKYSHKIFFEVAKTPLLSTDLLKP